MSEGGPLTDQQKNLLRQIVRLNQAYHEAGHFVVHAAIGSPVDPQLRVSADGNTGNYSCTSSGEHPVIIGWYAWGGDCANQVIDFKNGIGQEDDDQSHAARYWGDQTEKVTRDWIGINALGKDRYRSRVHVKRLVVKHWSLIEQVAGALFQREELFGWRALRPFVEGYKFGAWPRALKRRILNWKW